jgi:iron complex transport system substrate-binding protein
MKKIAAILIMVFFLVGCGGKTSTISPNATSLTATSSGQQTPFTVIDDLERATIFQSFPTRIVAAGKATSLLLDAIYMFPEAQERMIAYELRLQNKDNFMTVVEPKSEGKALFSKDAGVEQIAPLRPDLVILKTYMREKLGEPLEELGIPVVYLDLETPDTYLSDIGLLGRIFGNPERAQEIQDYYRGVTNSVTDFTQNLSTNETPSVLLLQYSVSGGETSFNIPGKGYIQTMLVKMAGGNPIWESAQDTTGWLTVNLEQIAAWNPDIIFIIWYQGDAATIVEGLKTAVVWKNLAAVKNNQIYGFAGDFLSWDQSDSRWILGLNWLGAKIHPEIFQEYNLMESVSIFYHTLYALTAQQIEDLIYPALKGSIE